MLWRVKIQNRQEAEDSRAEQYTLATLESTLGKLGGEQAEDGRGHREG